MIPHSRPSLGEEEKKAVLKVLDSLQLAQGPRTAEFEKKFCALTGRKYAVAVSSGTSALMLALAAMEIGKGDEVIVPSFACSALLHAVHFLGARAVPADIDPEDFNLDPARVKTKIRRKTRAVIAAHSFGRVSRMKEIENLGIPVLEDATQALGASIGQKKAGAFGEAAIFSFYATKMSTTGEGGMVLTDSKRLAGILEDLRDYDKKETHRLRTNSKMTDLEAAMGLEQVCKLPEFIRRRREIASRYRVLLKDFPLSCPVEDESRDHVYFRFVVRIQKSESWLKELRRRRIDAKRPIFKPLHRVLQISPKEFPETERAIKEACSLPIFPSMTAEEWEQISSAFGMMAGRACQRQLSEPSGLGPAEGGPDGESAGGRMPPEQTNRRCRRQALPARRS